MLYLHVYISCISLPLSHLHWVNVLIHSHSIYLTGPTINPHLPTQAGFDFQPGWSYSISTFPQIDQSLWWQSTTLVSHLSLFNIPSIDYGSLALGLHETDEATNEDHSCKPRQSRINGESLELSRKIGINQQTPCMPCLIMSDVRKVGLQQSRMTKSYKSIKIKSHIRIDQRSMQQLFCFYHRCPRRQRRSAWNCCLVAEWLFQSLSWARRSWDETLSMDQLSVPVIFQYESVSISQSQTKRPASTVTSWRL